MSLLFHDTLGHTYLHPCVVVGQKTGLDFSHQNERTWRQGRIGVAMNTGIVRRKGASVGTQFEPSYTATGMVCGSDTTRPSRVLGSD